MNAAHRARLRAAALAGFLAALVMVHYHDVYWYAPDEGNYAHVAERLLDGEVLHRDVQDVHPGYINFVNALALRVFGEHLVSMRYPLVLLGMVQGAIMAWLLAHRGILVAVAAGVSTPFAGMLLFPNPSANWYGLTLALLLALVLESAASQRRVIVLAGVACGVALMFRQLTGAILGAAALVHLMLMEERNRPAGGRTPWLARAVIAITLAGTLAYVAWATDAVGFLLFAPAPLVILLAAFRDVAASTATTTRRLGLLAAGVAIGVLPMAAYVLATGSGREFLTDTVAAAIGIPGLDVFAERSYATYLMLGLLGVASLLPGATLTGAFWLALVCAPLTLALRVGGRILRGVPVKDLGGAVVVGAFGGLLMVHTPSPFYVGAGVPVVGLALVRLGIGRSVSWLAALMLLIGVSAAWQVGRPRAVGSIWGRGQQPHLVETGGRNGLRVSSEEWHWYSELVGDIQGRSERDDAIFALPGHAELYFLAERRNPTRFFNFALGVRTEAAVDSLLGAFERDPPRLVIYDPLDLIHSPYELAVVRWAARNSREIIRHDHVWMFDLGPTPGSGVDPDN